MTQREPRLGDIVDDYCPRERRITNHVVVAMIDHDVKQTRCATCESDHEYKHAKVPAQRARKAALSPLDSAIDEMTRARTAPTVPEFPQEQPRSAEPADVSASDRSAAGAPVETSGDTDVEDTRNDDDGPVHRRLIRASLPRPEGHSPERRPTEFTVRQPGRYPDRGGREVDGNRANSRDRGRGPSDGGQSRFGGQRRAKSGGGQRPQNGPRNDGQPGGQGRPGGGRRRRGR